MINSFSFRIMPQKRFVATRFLNSSCIAAFERGTRCAPSILVLFINMMLFKKTTPEDRPKELMTEDDETRQTCDEFMFEGQEILQKFFLAVAILCVPVMLFGKPLYVVCQNRKLKANVSCHHFGLAAACPFTCFLFF